MVVLVKPEHKRRISHVHTSSVKTGIANTLGREEMGILSLGGCPMAPPRPLSSASPQGTRGPWVSPFFSMGRPLVLLTATWPRAARRPTGDGDTVGWTGVGLPHPPPASEAGGGPTIIPRWLTWLPSPPHGIGGTRTTATSCARWHWATSGSAPSTSRCASPTSSGSGTSTTAWIWMCRCVSVGSWAQGAGTSAHRSSCACSGHPDPHH